MRITEAKLKQIIREMLSDPKDAQAAIERNAQKLSAPKKLVHRTHDADLTVDKLDPTSPRDSKQSRGGKLKVVGVYAYAAEDADEEIVKRYGDRKVAFTLPAGARILDLRGEQKGATARVTKAFADELLAQGIDAIVGYDLVGPPEWVILRPVW